MTPGGVRIGAPAMTSRGLKEADFVKIAEFLGRVLKVRTSGDGGKEEMLLIPRACAGGRRMKKEYGFSVERVSLGGFRERLHIYDSTRSRHGLENRKETNEGNVFDPPKNTHKYTTPPSRSAWRSRRRTARSSPSSKRVCWPRPRSPRSALRSSPGPRASRCRASSK